MYHDNPVPGHSFPSDLPASRGLPLNDLKTDETQESCHDDDGTEQDFTMDIEGMDSE